MKRRTQLMLLLLSLGQATLVFAHAVVTDDTLKIAPIHANQQSQAALTFNSQIEPGLSQIFLVRKGDSQERLVIENGSKRGQLIVHIPALESGDYALRLKVFAADGHLTEDVIHFSVSH